MEGFLNQLAFGWFPYLAVTVLIVGSILRFDKAQYSWRSQSSQFLRRKQMLIGSNLFHLGILALLGGHFVGLLTPINVFDYFGIGHGFKQMMALVVGGIAGGFSFIGATMLLHRRLFDPRIRATSTFADTGIIVLLWLQLLLGLATIPVSLSHLDGGEMVRFMAWANGIFTFDQQASSNVAGASLIFKLHIFLGLTIFLLFPFTRLVHMLSAPVRYLWRPGYQVVRSRKLAS